MIQGPRGGRARLVALMALMALVGSGCSADEPAATAVPAPTSPAGWTELPRGPLSARVPATGVWTGTELVVLGGSDAAQCGGVADCFVPANPLADGTALDPGTGEWRRLPDAPMAFAVAESVWTGRRVLVAARSTFLDPARTLLALDPATDTWSTLAAPPGDITGDPVWTGDRWIFPGAPGAGDWYYLPDEDRWERGSPDPLNLTERQLAWAGGRLVAIGSRYEDRTTNGVYRAAVLDRDGTTWRELPVSDISNNGGTWIAVGDRLFNVMWGTSEPNEGGAPLPHGGVLDLSWSTWSDLPEPAPGPPAEPGPMPGTGYVGPAGDWIVDDRTLLQTANSTWAVAGPRPDRADPGVAVWTGAELLTWGGVVGPEEPGAAAPELSNAGYAYRLPST